MTKREALKLALMTLENWKNVYPDEFDEFDEDALSNIKEVLAQPEQEPLAWVEAQRICDIQKVDETMQAFVENPCNDNAVCLVQEILAAYTAPPQPEPDCREVGICVKSGLVCLGQPQRKWVGLTDEDYEDLANHFEADTPHSLVVRFIENRLKEKNT